MFPLNFWTDETKKSTLTTSPPSTPANTVYSLSTSPKPQQSETETSSLLKIRDLLSNSNQQNEIHHRRQRVLGSDNR
jgi:hypothetical protein